MSPAQGGPIFIEEPQDSNLTKIAYVKLKNAILQNQFKSGRWLSGSKLAKAFNMSRTPVREALNILEKEGFVEIRNGLGVAVKEITENDIHELIEVRLALECCALESVTFEVDRPELERLEQGWREMQIKWREHRLSDLDEIMALDYATHDFLVASSHNSHLVGITKNISVHIRRVQFLSVTSLNAVDVTIQQHLDLLAAIIDGDIPTALVLLREHIQEAGPYIFNKR